MQKFSLLAFVCCLMLAFTACKKETLLETNQDLNPTNLSTNKLSSLEDIKDATTASLDAEDSASIAKAMLNDNKRVSSTASTECFGPINGICGTPVIYSNCYYKYQIWNDPTNLYVDLYFPSSVVGWKTDCNGRKCQYYVTPCITLDLYNANGVKIGTVNVTSSNITVTETRITFNINSLLAQYPTLKCVKLSGSFYRMKKCSNCAALRVGTECIVQRQFCLQQCESVCPTVNNISVNNSSLCGSGTVTGSVAISGDATKTSTTWTLDGQTQTGNTTSFSLPANTTCLPITKTIHAKVICTSNQSVLAERDFTVTVNPTVTVTITRDFVLCTATIEFSCPDGDVITNLSWTKGSQSGTGSSVPLTSNHETLNYSFSAFGCNYSGSEDDLYCEPL